MQNEITQYIRKTANGRTQKVGVLVAGITENGIIQIGWSKAALSRGDNFDMQKGSKIAVGRMIEGSNISVPRSIRQDVIGFMGRCKRYYKNAAAFAPVVGVS
jgi:hypothetical protein